MAETPTRRITRRRSSSGAAPSPWWSTKSVADAVLKIAADYPRAAAVDWDAIVGDGLLTAVEHHRIGAFVGPSVDAGLTPRDASEYSKLVAIRRKFAQARMTADLRHIVSAADVLQRPWALLKGPTLVATAYEGAAREYSDLDILVDGREMERMTGALLDAGGVLLDRNFDLLAGIVSGEVGIQMPAGAVVDLHWHPIHSVRVRRHFRVSTPELLGRVQPIEIGDDLVVPGLDPTDALLYLCLHACLSGAERVLWFKDIDLVARRLAWDRAELLDRARRWRIGAPAALMLQRARRMLDTPVDPDLLRQLCSRPFLLRLASVLDSWAPPHRQRRNSYDRTLFRSVRPSAAATGVEVVKQLASERILPSRLDSVRPWRAYYSRGLIPISVESTSDQRSVYFDKVAKEVEGQDPDPTPKIAGHHAIGDAGHDAGGSTP